MSDRAKALEVLQKSGVLNPKMTLGEIMDTASRLEALNPGDLVSWTLISRDFVYKGGLTEEIQDQFQSR